MSVELNEYLMDLPIYVFKLVDGNTIIAKLIDNDESGVIISNPHQLDLFEGDRKIDIIMNEWMYGCGKNEVIITLDKIIAQSEADLPMKKFYSKVMLKEKLHQSLSDRLKSKQKKRPPTSMEWFFSFLDGLEQQDSRKDDYIGWDGHPKPWPPEEDI